jgi:hypothetical protein
MIKNSEELIIELERLIKQGNIKEFEEKFSQSSLQNLYQESGITFCTSLTQTLILQEIQDTGFDEEYCVQLMKLCIKRGESLNMALQNDDSMPKKTLLMLAVEHNFLKIVELIINQPNVNIKYRDTKFEDSIDALDYAAILGHAKIFEMLYAKAYQSSDLLIENSSKFYTLLDHAILSNSKEIINILLDNIDKRNVDPNLVASSVLPYTTYISHHLDQINRAMDIYHIKCNYKVKTSLDQQFISTQNQRFATEISKIKHSCEEKDQILSHLAQAFCTTQIYQDYEQSMRDIYDKIGKIETSYEFII